MAGDYTIKLSLWLREWTFWTWEWRVKELRLWRIWGGGGGGVDGGCSMGSVELPYLPQIHPESLGNRVSVSTSSNPCSQNPGSAPVPFLFCPTRDVLGVGAVFSPSLFWATWSQPPPEMNWRYGAHAGDLVGPSGTRDPKGSMHRIE